MLMNHRKKKPLFTSFTSTHREMDFMWNAGFFDSRATITDKIFSHQLSILLHEFYKNEEFCDVVLESNGMQLKAHKLMLTAGSMFFKTFFQSKFYTDNNRKNVQLDNLHPEALKALIDFIYTSKMCVTETIAFYIVEAADYLGMSCIRALIEPYLLTLVPSLPTRILKLADFFNYHQLRNAAKSYCLMKFCKLPNFDELSANLLEELVCSVFWSATTEKIISERISEWARHDFPNREKDLPYLLQRVRRQVLDKPLLEERPLMSSKMPPEKMWLEYPDYRDNNEYRCRVPPQAILVIGGWRKLVLNTAEFYSIKCGNTWRISIARRGTDPVSRMKSYRLRPAVVNLNNRVIVIGGTGVDDDGLSSCEEYLIETNKWRALPSLPRPLQDCAAAVCDGRVYVFGGDMCSTLYMLETGEKERWRVIANFHIPRQKHCMVAEHGYLFILGGYLNQEDVATNSVWRYDTVYSRLVELPPMKEPRIHFGATIIKSCIYVMGGENFDGFTAGVERYDILRNEWESMESMFQPKAMFAVINCDRNIFCVGGEDQFKLQSSFLRYNTYSNSWHCENSMRTARMGLGAVIVFQPTEKANQDEG